MITVYDVIVIGGGPAGLSAALVFGRQRRDVLTVDGGRPRNARASEMHMLLSRDGFAPAELLEIGKKELAAYPSVKFRQGTVVAAQGHKNAFDVELADGGRERARRLLLATGQVDEPYAHIEGLHERFGHSVFHCPFCHGWEARDKTLAVITQDPKEATMALYVRSRFSDDVVLCTNGPLDLPDTLVARLDEHNVQRVEEPILEVTGEPDNLTVRFADGTALARQAIFHRAPSRQHSTLAEKLGCAILPDGTVRVDARQQTTVPGVAAAGDTAKLEQLPDATTFVVAGASDGVRAAVWLENDLFSDDMGM